MQKRCVEKPSTPPDPVELHLASVTSTVMTSSLLSLWRILSLFRSRRFSSLRFGGWPLQTLAFADVGVYRRLRLQTLAFAGVCGRLRLRTLAFADFVLCRCSCLQTLASSDVGVLRRWRLQTLASSDVGVCRRWSP